MSNWSYVEYFEIFKIDETLISWWTFSSEMSQEVGFVIQIGNIIP